jgi:hypothetical protein
VPKLFQCLHSWRIFATPTSIFFDSLEEALQSCLLSNTTEAVNRNTRSRGDLTRSSIGINHID